MEALELLVGGGTGVCGLPLIRLGLRPIHLAQRARNELKLFLICSTVRLWTHLAERSPAPSVFERR